LAQDLDLGAQTLEFGMQIESGQVGHRGERLRKDRDSIQRD
jgi:hypothetical protein